MASDILFINPGFGQNYQGVIALAPAIAPPAWLLLLADFCRYQGHEVAIYDVNIRGWGPETAEILLEGSDPRLIVIWVAGHNPSAGTQTMPVAGKIARDLKAVAPDLPIAMGGVHPSALPEKTLIEEAIDYVIVGEGFRTVSRITWHLKGQGPLEDIPGLCWDEGRSSPAPWIDPEADLHGYAWDLLDAGLEAYRCHDHHVFQDAHKSRDEGFLDIRSPYVTIYTSLGCRHHCGFCVTPGFFGPGHVRYWSPETVVGWIDELVERGVRNIRIEDDIFLSADRRVETICDLLIERGHDLNLWCYGRVRPYPKALLCKMKAAGFTWICLGIETAQGKNISAGVHTHCHDAFGCVRSIQAVGISVIGNFMFGLPGERMRDLHETLQMAINLQCEYANFYSMMSLPGSKIFSDGMREMKIPILQWDAYSQLGYDSHPMGTGNFVLPHQVLGFRDKAFRTYFSDPDYLDMIDRKFKRNVRKHIETTTSKPIKRRLLGG